MPLFKYVPLDRFDILVDEEIRYTQLGELNDPFEMPVFLEKAEKISTLEHHVDKIMPDLARTEYKKLSPAKRMKVPFKAFLKKAEKRAQQVKPELTQTLAHFIEHITPKLQEQLRHFDRHFGVLSLTETPDNLLMWAHYSEQHTGMVIEFDETHSIFDERKSHKDDFRYLRQVVYSDERPILDTFGDFSITNFMLMKSAEWSYERERRIAKSITDARRVIPASPYDICLFDMPASAVKRVILGARVSPANMDRVKQDLGSHKHLGHIRLQQASLDVRLFALNFADC